MTDGISQKSLTPQKADDALMAVAIAQTSYALNNSYDLRPGKPLKYIDDAALVNTPGARPLNLSIREGFIITGVYKIQKTGLDVFLAANPTTHEIISGIAGTNGFGSDRPDTKEDFFKIGANHARELYYNTSFIKDLAGIIESFGGIDEVKSITFAGQSLGGGTGPQFGKLLVFGDKKHVDDEFFNSFRIPTNKLRIFSVNGPGTEYAGDYMGFTAEQNAIFETEVNPIRISTQNELTGEYDLVSRTGGRFQGTTYILKVKEAKTGPELHRDNYAVSEGIESVQGDLTKLVPGEVPQIDHRTLSKMLAFLEDSIPIANNLVSLTWSGYVSLLFSKPGEGASGLSATLQSFAGFPKPLADFMGAIGELALRYIPATNLGPAIKFLFGTYMTGQAIGSSTSVLPPFDADATFGKVQEGWTRAVVRSSDAALPPVVIDTNLAVGTIVTRFLDGRTMEVLADGTQVLSHPEAGVAVINKNGSGLLVLRSVDQITGDYQSSTVAFDSSTKLTFDENHWIASRVLDANAGQIEQIVYQGRQATRTNRFIGSDPDAQSGIENATTSAFTVAADDPGFRLDLRGTQYVVPVSPGHVQVVSRNEDRLLLQTVDIDTTNPDRTESVYRDGSGTLIKTTVREQLSQTTERITVFDGDGQQTQSTVTQQILVKNQWFTLIDEVSVDGKRKLTTLGPDGKLTSEILPLDAKPAQLVEALQQTLYDDVASFLTALRQRDTAGMIMSVARITLDYARSERLAIKGYETVIGDISSGLALVNSLHSLQSGDTLAKIGGAVGLLNSADYFSNRMLGSKFLTADQAKFLGTASAILSIASITKLGDMIEAGQLGSATATVISTVNALGYLSGSSALMGPGAIFSFNPITMVVGAFVLDSLFGDDPPPPPPVGTARFVREDDGRLGYQISNDNPLGRDILKKQMDELLPKLQQQIDSLNRVITNPAHRMQLVTSRMPAIHISSWISYGGNGVNNYFFAVEQANPMRDTPNWMGIARQDLVNLYGQTLLLPEAIIQQWEADHLHAKFGADESHWQTEAAWLRAQSPTEQQRSKLQAAYDQAVDEWKAISAGKLVASATTTSNKSGNVTLLPTLAARRDAAQQHMAAAKLTIDNFNQTYPEDPALAARATPEQEAEFVRTHAARQSVALQWTKLIAIDIGNDGISINDLPGNVGSDLDSILHQQVARFDVDGDGYREATQWIAASEAILGIDRSGNGTLDDGSELFNAPDTPFDQHGLPSLAYFDANGDGLIDYNDPAFRQLRLWVDLDGDGSSGALEVFDMDLRPVALANITDTDALRSPMAIDAIDLRNNSVRYADGASSSVQTVSLLSQLQGLAIVHDEATDNLNVLHEDALRENFITLVDDMSALTELQSASLSADRRSELIALARRYGLNPESQDFANIVQSLRASASDAGQDTVIFFGDDDVWVDPAVRERLAQMRISFRKFSDATQAIAGETQLARLGTPLQAQALSVPVAFDDRWVASRKLSASDIRSDPTPTSEPQVSIVEQLTLPEDVYSLLEITKGAQDGGLVTQHVIPLSDAASPSATAGSTTVFVTQQPVASLPVMTLTANEDATLSLGYAQLGQSGALRLLGLRSSAQGTASIDDARERVLFQPQANFAGEARLTVALSDAQGKVFEQPVTIRFAPINDAPLVLGETISTTEDVPLLIDVAALLTNDHDPEGDPVAVTGIGRVALGKAELLANGQIHYTPPSDHYDVVDTVEYFVSDSSGATSVGKIRISLAAANDAPSVVSERVINAREDQVLRIGTQLLLANDFDVDTDARLGAEALHITAVGSAVHGEVRLEGEQILFRPERDYNGVAAFSYTVTDATGRSTTGRTQLRIDPVSDAPLVAGEHIDAKEDEVLIIDNALLLQNDLDQDILRGETQTLSVVAVDQADGGRVQLRDGKVVFTPDANRAGSAGFRYTVSDGAGGHAQGKVDIALAAVNDAPMVLPQQFRTDEDQPLSISFANLLAGATDIDDQHSQLHVTGTGKIIGGSVIQLNDRLIFTPDKNYFGAATVEYSVADAQGLATTASFTVDINGINDAPIALDGVRLQPVADEDQEIRISESALLKLFVDAEGDAMRILPASVTTLNAGDRISFDEQRREMVFRAAPNANGEHRLSFAVTDGSLSSQAVSLLAQLRPVNDLSEVRAIGFKMLEDGGEINPSKSAWTYVSHDLLLSGASDVDGDWLSIASVANGRTTGASGSQAVQVVNDSANQRVAIMAPLNYTGHVEFEFSVADGQGGLVTQKAYGAVSPVNDAPLFTSTQLASTFLSIMGSQRTTYRWRLSAWDPDETQPLKFAVVRNPLYTGANTKVTTNRAVAAGGMQMEVDVWIEVVRNWGASTNDSMEFSATDALGGRSNTSISFMSWYRDPIVIDLDNDGLEFIDLDHSRVSFDIDGSGQQQRIAWVSGDDGLLAFDADQDGQINRMNEISFWSHVSQPLLGRSDLQALQEIEFDSNQNGMLDASDAKWGQFRLWRDLNSNGRSDDGELQTLAQAHIKQLYLNGNVLNRAEGPDVLVRAYTRAVTDDDRLLQAADVWLNSDNGPLPDTTPPQEQRQASLMNADQLASLLAQLAATATGSNHAPLLYGHLPTQYANESEPFRLDISPNFFIDPDTGDVLQFTATLADGSPLPAWLSFDASLLRFEGTPSATDAAQLQIMLRATDPVQATTEAGFTLMVSPVNHAPELTEVLPFFVWQADSDNRFVLPQTLFRDSDANDLLFMDVRLANGQPLPEWLNYEPSTLTLSGKPTAAQLSAPLALRVTAMDIQGAQLSVFTQLQLAPSASAAAWGASKAASTPVTTITDVDPSWNALLPPEALFGALQASDTTFQAGLQSAAADTAQPSSMTAMTSTTAISSLGSSFSPSATALEINTLAASNTPALITGTPGDDTYHFSPGNGWHILLDPDGSDLIRIDDAFADSRLRFAQRGDDLELSADAMTDGMTTGMTISGWYQANNAGAAIHQIERLQLSDGRILQSVDVDKLIAAQSTGSAAQTSQYWR